jgi:hypothetical protein
MDDKIKKRINELIALGENALRAPLNDYYIDEAKFYEFKTSSLSFLKLIFTEDHPVYKEFEKKCQGAKKDDGKIGVAILRSAKSDIDGGWLMSFKDLVSSEIFTDFLEMAEYLLSQSYKDPAAVIIGSVIEEHLRFLCAKNNIDTESIKNGKTEFKKADTLNSELYTNQIYNKLDNKSVTTWLDLRNKAAHGHYSEYNLEQVKLMYQGVFEFILRTR